MPDLLAAHTLRDTWKARLDRLAILHELTIVVMFIYVLLQIKFPMLHLIDVAIISFVAIEMTVYIYAFFRLARAEATLTEAIIDAKDRGIDA